MKYDHKAKASRQDREVGAFFPRCQVCRRLIQEVVAGWVNDEDGHNAETYWRHAPERPVE